MFGSEHTEVWSYIKNLKSEVKSSLQMVIKIINFSQMNDLISSICTCTV